MDLNLNMIHIIAVKKVNLFNFCFFVFIFFFGVKADDLIGYFDFNGNYSDLSISNNNMSLFIFKIV